MDIDSILWLTPINRLCWIFSSAPRKEEMPAWFMSGRMNCGIQLSKALDLITKVWIFL